MAETKSLGMLLEQKYEEYVGIPTCSEDFVTRAGEASRRVHCRTGKKGLSAIIWPQRDSWGFRLSSPSGHIRIPINDHTTLGSDPIQVFAERQTERVSIGLKDRLVEAPDIAVRALQKVAKRLQPFDMQPKSASLSLEQSLDVDYVLTHDEQGNVLRPLAGIVSHLFEEARLAQVFEDKPYIHTNFDYEEGCGIAEELHAASALWHGTLIMPLDSPDEPFVQLRRTNDQAFLLWTNDGTFPVQESGFLIEERQVLVPVDTSVAPSGLSELNPQGLLFLRDVLEHIRPISYPES